VDNEKQSSLFLFSYFKGHGDGLHLASSEDGYNWKALNNDQPFIVPQVGPERLMRDPFLCFGRDGLFHLVWTAGWRGRGIGYAFSNDLITWSSQEFIEVMAYEPDTQNCWAPEICWDERSRAYIVYWASSIPGRFPATDATGDEGLNHRMYYTVTPDFKTFTKPALFIDPGFNVIDATVVKDDNRYLIFMKDERSNPCQKNIRLAITDGLFNEIKTVTAPISGAYWAEGPSAVKIGGEWFVYFDKYKANRIGGVCSSDLLQWCDISHQLHFPPGAQHGSVGRVPVGYVQHLL
jgi:beta-xylosidase